MGSRVVWESAEFKIERRNTFEYCLLDLKCDKIDVTKGKGRNLQKRVDKSEQMFYSIKTGTFVHGTEKNSGLDAILPNTDWFNIPEGFWDMSEKRLIWKRMTS